MFMDNLIINNQSLSILISLRDRLPQSLLLTGSSGVGLYTIANSLAKNKNNTIFTVLPTDKDDNIDIEKGSIRVSSIRDLYRQTRTEQSNPQIIIIDFADKMSLTSQNAFLKLLEEPNPSIHFILLSHHPSMLLATILSRVWRINIKPISKKQSLNLLSSLKIFDQSTINKIMFGSIDILFSKIGLIDSLTNCLIHSIHRILQMRFFIIRRLSVDPIQLCCAVFCESFVVLFLLF